jgi:DNA polymerase-3 subunit alpha/error-prone DNA polymerase
MHCGGLVITPDPIRRYVPVERSVDGYPLLAWEKEETEAAGFVKIDLIGNRSLAVIRDTLAEQGIVIDRDPGGLRKTRQPLRLWRKGTAWKSFTSKAPPCGNYRKRPGQGTLSILLFIQALSGL